MNENFDIFVINLARRQDRWHQISTDLSTMGLRHKQKIALDGKHVFQSDNDMVRQGLVTQEALDADHALSRGAVALTLTSREVWEECKQSDKPYCVISHKCQSDLTDSYSAFCQTNKGLGEVCQIHSDDNYMSTTAFSNGGC